MSTAPDRFYVKPDNVKHRTGAGGVVARRDGSRALIALIRDRGDHEYVLPKGGVEYGETLEQAAAREIAEEAGFKRLNCLAELGVGERLAGKKNIWQKTHYFLFLTDEVKGQPTDRRDWEVAWFDLNDLPAMYWREQENLIVQNREKIARLVSATPR